MLYASSVAEVWITSRNSRFARDRKPPEQIYSHCGKLQILRCVQDSAGGSRLSVSRLRFLIASTVDPSLRSGFRLRTPAFAHARNTPQLNKSFCFLFTQTGGLFEMILPPIPHNRCKSEINRY